MQRDAQPSYFQQGAAQAAIQRRKLVQELRAAAGSAPARAPLGGTVGPGAFVGQLVLTQPGRQPRRMSDAEYLTHVEVWLICLGMGEASIRTDCKNVLC